MVCCDIVAADCVWAAQHSTVELLVLVLLGLLQLFVLVLLVLVGSTLVQ